MADLDEDYIADMEDTLETYERPYDPQQPVACLDEKPVTPCSGSRTWTRESVFRSCRGKSGLGPSRWGYTSLQRGPLEDCLLRFEEIYSDPMSRFRKLVATAAAHHRFLWIHPFLDGNGRVARLMAHAMFRRLGIGSSLWAVSRGLARNAAEYKALLMAADRPREGDYDGRGSLSERALVDFCAFFLRISIDQVRFMQSILDPGNLLRRIERYCRDEGGAVRLPLAFVRLLPEHHPRTPGAALLLAGTRRLAEWCQGCPVGLAAAALGTGSWRGPG